MKKEFIFFALFACVIFFVLAFCRSENHYKKLNDYIYINVSSKFNEPKNIKSAWFKVYNLDKNLFDDVNGKSVEYARLRIKAYCGEDKIQLIETKKYDSSEMVLYEKEHLRSDAVSLNKIKDGYVYYNALCFAKKIYK